MPWFPGGTSGRTDSHVRTSLPMEDLMALDDDMTTTPDEHGPADGGAGSGGDGGADGVPMVAPMVALTVARTARPTVAQAASPAMT